MTPRKWRRSSYSGSRFRQLEQISSSSSVRAHVCMMQFPSLLLAVQASSCMRSRFALTERTASQNCRALASKLFRRSTPHPSFPRPRRAVPSLLALAGLHLLPLSVGPHPSPHIRPPLGARLGSLPPPGGRGPHPADFAQAFRADLGRSGLPAL